MRKTGYVYVKKGGVAIPNVVTEVISMSATAVGKWTFFLNERPRVACDISLSGRSCVEINSHKSKCKVNYMTCILRVPDAFPPAPQFGLVSCFVDLQVRTTKTYSYLRSMRYIKRI